MLTTLDKNIEENIDILKMISEGMALTDIPPMLIVQNVEVLLNLDQVTLRRYHKAVEESCQNEHEFVLLARQQEDFSKIEDPQFQRWQMKHCTKVTNTDLLKDS